MFVRSSRRWWTSVLVAVPILSCAAAGLAQGQSGPPYDLLIRGGTVVDGTGRARYRADVAVQGDRIARVSTTPIDPTGARRVIDATGRIVAPGFIDLHAHLEPLLRLPAA